MKADKILERGAKHLKDRSKLRDSPDGERSMRSAVCAFNELYGLGLTETHGWQFMVILKMSRARTGEHCIDDFEDMAAYSALAGESAEVLNKSRGSEK